MTREGLLLFGSEPTPARRTSLESFFFSEHPTDAAKSRFGSCGVRQLPGEEDASAAGHDELMAVELVTDGGTDHLLARSRVPERLSVTGIEGYDVTDVVSRKDEPGVGGEYAGPQTTLTDLMTPANLPSLVVDRFDDAFAP